MKDFPTLAEMGVQRRNEISHYSLRQIGKDRDILKIFYKRKKGSVLPERKTFKFGRSIKGSKDIEQANQIAEVHEISPFLQKAVSELDTIVKKHHDTQDNVALLLSRIEQLEKELKFATEEMKLILDRM